MKGISAILAIMMILFVAGCSKKGDAVTNDGGNGQPRDARYASSENRLLVGACYYPWYRATSHWSGDNLRENLLPPQPPVLGHYDCIMQSTITQHVRWSVQAGVDFWISSWWGQGSATDDVIRQGQLTNPDFLKQMAYCILYEPVGGSPISVTDSYISGFLSDLAYLEQYHFSKSNYLKIDNKPVLYIYLTRTMQGNVQRLFTAADSLLIAGGFAGLYVVGDEAYWGTPDSTRFQYFEAATTYNPHTNSSSVSDPVAFVNACVSNLYTPWMNLANAGGKSFWVDVIPGFNDLGVRPAMNHPVIPRGRESTFAQFLSAVKPVLKAQTIPLRVLVITSWNEWHEDTQIEPTIVADTATQLPTTLTRGNWYYGYGTRCLDTLAAFKTNF